jgi:hypothetical protein
MARRLGSVVFFFLLSIPSFTCEQAFAEWDFTLSGGSASWYYGQYVQLGDRGFFGKYNIDASATGDFAPLNSWVGNRTDVNYLTADTTEATQCSPFFLRSDAIASKLNLPELDHSPFWKVFSLSSHTRTVAWESPPCAGGSYGFSC